MLNKVGTVFGILKYVCDRPIVVKKFMFAISSHDEFLSEYDLMAKLREVYAES